MSVELNLGIADKSYPCSIEKVNGGCRVTMTGELIDVGTYADRESFVVKVDEPVDAAGVIINETMKAIKAKEDQEG